MKNLVEFFKEFYSKALLFAEPVINWLLVKLCLRDEFVDVQKEIAELYDEEAWKEAVKNADEGVHAEIVSESEMKEEEEEKMLDMLNDDDRLSGCKVRDRVMPVGTRWTDKKTCTYYECKDMNLLTEIRCPEGSLECRYGRCKEVPGDPNGEFPDCCPEVQCEPPKFRNFEELMDIWDQCKHPRDCL